MIEILEQVSALQKANSEAAREANRIAEVAAFMLHVPEINGPKSKCFFSMGRMLGFADDKGKTSQDIRKAAPTVQTIEDWVNWLIKDRRIGIKFGAPCYYGGHFFLAQDTTKWNCAVVQMLTLDLDAKICARTGKLICAIKNRADLLKVVSWLKSKGMFLFFTSASHDPENGKFCCKFILWCRRPMTYEQAHKVGKELRIELANVLGIVPQKRVAGEVHPWDCIDPVMAHPVQCQLSPRWKDLRIAQQAEWFFAKDLPVWDQEVYLLRANELIASEKLQKIRKAPAELAMSQKFAALAGSGKVDPAKSAQEELDKLGVIFPGCGTSDASLWRAACILRNWGWDEQDAISEMEGRYPGFPYGRIPRKVSDAFRIPGLHGSSLRAAEEEAGAGVALEEFFEGGVKEFGLVGSETADTNPGGPVVQHSEVDQECGGQNPQPADCLETAFHEVAVQRTRSKKEKDSAVDQTSPSGPRITKEEVHTRWLPTLATFAGLPKLVVVKAPPGTGKNERLAPAWAELEARGGRGLCVSYRRSLTRANTGRWSKDPRSRRKNYMDCTAPIRDNVVDICVNSLGSIADPENPENMLETIMDDVTVWDEWQQTLRHVFSNGSEHELVALWNAMGARFKRSKTNIIQDAHLSIVGLHAAFLLLGWDDPHGEDVDVHFVRSRWKADPKEVYKWRSEEAFLRQFMWSIQEPTFPGTEVRIHDLFLSSSAIQCEAMHQAVLDFLPSDEVLLVTADTIRDDLEGVRDAIADPRKFSLYRVVIGSPAIFTGLSIEEYHWRCWLHLRASVGGEAVHTSEDGHQAMGRPRYAIETHSWAEGKQCILETNASKILADIQTKSEESRKSKYIVGAYKEIYSHGVTEIAVSEDTLTILTVKASILAHEARTGGQLGDRVIKDKKGKILATVEGKFWKFLRDEQNCILLDHPNDAITDQDKKAVRAEVKDDRDKSEGIYAVRICTANKIPIATAEALKKAPAPPRGMAAAIERSFLEHFYGKDATPELALRDRRGKARPVIRALMHSVGIQELGEKGKKDVARLDAKAVDKSKLAISAKSFAKARRIVLLLEHLFKIKSLKKAALTGEIISIPGTLALDESVAEDLRRHLGIKATECNTNSPNKLLSTLLSRVGLRFEKTPTRPRVDGKRVRLYRLDRDHFEQMMDDGSGYYDQVFQDRPERATQVPVDANQLVKDILGDGEDVAPTLKLVEKEGA